MNKSFSVIGQKSLELIFMVGALPLVFPLFMDCKESGVRTGENNNDSCSIGMMTCGIFGYVCTTLETYQIPVVF